MQRIEDYIPDEKTARKNLQRLLEPKNDFEDMKELMDHLFEVDDNPIVDADLQTLSQAGLGLLTVLLSIGNELVAKFVWEEKNLELLLTKEGSCLIRELTPEEELINTPQKESVKPSTPTEDPPGPEDDADIPEWMDISDALEKINSLRIASQQDTFKLY